MSVALQDYLQEQPGTTFKKLYKQPSAALAVLRRMLPHLAKTIVMAMLYMPTPILESDLLTWFRDDAAAARDEALSVLERLHILNLVPEPPVPRAYKLSPSFGLSLRQALSGGGSHNSFGVPVNSVGKKVTTRDLDIYARRQWETILYYMVGNAGTGIGGSHTTIANSTKTLLQAGNYVTSKGVITKEGFTFLLQDTNTQVWSLLIVYLEELTPRLGMNPVEVLSFLFTLGSLELGQDYGTSHLTDTQKILLEDLSDFGVVYRPPGDPSRFFPTRLATTLTSDSAGLVESATTSSDQGFIILETNHRLYAYTSSPLQIAVINLFARLNVRFPNLVAGKITKKSIQRAIECGITSDQIISYLYAYAHPQMRKSETILPPTVVDQIRLWQLEGDRMKATSGFLLKDFNPQEYEECAKYAENLGVLTWKNDVKRMFFVSRIEQIQAFLRNRTMRAGTK